ncbi:MAG: glutathione peroxidase [Phycisphaerales bacterium]
MKKTLAAVLFAGMLAGGFAMSGMSPQAEAPAAGAPGGASDKPAAASAYVLAHTLKDIDGNDVNLESFKGKVVLMVNVASKCGYTPQYKGLQELYEKKKDAGLVILGFPANEFGGQEPGSEADIKQFCHDTYKVTFPMFSKISVKGEKQHPLYKQLASQPAPVGGDPKWNFTKFLVDREGNVVARFDSRVAPDDRKLTDKVDELLAAAK